MIITKSLEKSFYAMKKPDVCIKCYELEEQVEEVIE